MTGDRPTLDEQIEAVEWAELYAGNVARAAAKRGDDKAIPCEFRRRLEAASETLRALQDAWEGACAR